ncbi:MULTISPECIES: hypothetical protein [Pseudomonas]|jgi:hypothetical protein|uniref:Uncharacterized protein n=1 Tax=Pseudomonas rhodesiae TaxID=76760 RepID=A0A8I1JAZ7_9PSED|nr:MULTISPECIES: hypothetical protein [Pseudomonas]MBI6599599.1 hypothetical protein [Pseudomonas sp. S4_EA_1b]MBI6623867.1 hypothetical protein [Pseudomonas rhodesiae]NMY80080.1 hypothetical protein [Pseudomonas rhodesiae]UVL10441.1 hypothetical protein LOY39_07030 [Pseudomonas rhodesiae]
MQGHAAEAQYSRSRNRVFGVVLLTGLSTVVLAWLLTCSMFGPLGQSMRAAQASLGAI